MLKDQNTIDLMPRTGYYEEYQLDPQSANTLMPGAIYGLTATEDGKVGQDGVNAAYASTTGDPATVEILIALEDALQGRDFNTPYQAGDVILSRRAISGDRYLARAVDAEYAYNDKLYLTQTTHGLYLTKTAPSGNAVPRAVALETYDVVAGMVDNLNPGPGGLVNLLRVRIL